MLFIVFNARGKRHDLNGLKMHLKIILSYMRGVKHIYIDLIGIYKKQKMTAVKHQFEKK